MVLRVSKGDMGTVIADLIKIDDRRNSYHFVLGGSSRSIGRATALVLDCGTS